MKIGFIGLGIMGKPMAKNLLKAGCTLCVFDLNKGAVEEVRLAGANAAVSIADAVAEADVIMTMLPNSPQVKEVVLGERGVKDAAKAGSVVIDMSSISPIASREVAAALSEKGIDMLDAPVSGGEPKAIDGTLAFMVGGKQDTFDRYAKLLHHMGATVERCGEIGAGNVTKLANQVVVAANIAAVSEALVLGKKAGVEPEAIFRAIRGGLAGSTVMDAKAPMMMAGNFAPGFRISLHIKDLANVLETGHTVGAPLPLSVQVMEMMQWLRAQGKDTLDHSALVQYYEALAGADVRS